MKSQCINCSPMTWYWHPLGCHSTLTKPNGHASNVRSDFVTCVNRKVGDANPIQICTNPSPLELHHASTWIMKILQSIRCHCKVTWLPLCLYVPPNHSHVTWLPSWRHWTVNIMPLRLQMPLDNQLTQIPLSHWTTTLFPDYQWKTEQQILFQSSATWLQIYFHSAIGIPLKLPDYQWITTQQI